MKWGLLALVMAWSFLGCSRELELSGKPGVDETSNGVAILVSDSIGHPVMGARLQVRTCNFVPQPGLQQASRPLDTFTNKFGMAYLDSIPQESWCIQVKSGGQGALVRLDSGSRGVIEDTVHLQKMGSVLGRVSLPPGVKIAWVQVLGLDMAVETDGEGFFRLDSLPPGEISLRAVVPASDSLLGSVEVTVASGVLSDSISLLPPAETALTFMFGARVSLNTRSSGISLAQGVGNFPLLLRLEGANFPREASFGGTDLRVLDLQEKELPFEIVSWDSIGLRALIWVGLDSVLANDSTQGLLLRWGRVLTLPHSSSQATFDTAQGWSGVWHLQRGFLDSARELRTPDATGAGHHALIQGAGNWGSDGPISGGMIFAGVESGLSIFAPNVEFGVRDITLELWVRFDAPGTFLRRSDLSNGWNHRERELFLGDLKYGVNGVGWHPDFLGWGNPNVYMTCSLAVDSAKWTHLAMRRTVNDSLYGQAKWFMDGTPVPTSSALALLEGDGPLDSIYVGTWQDSARAFHGSMEELRISRVARSDDWIRLSAISQSGAIAWITVQRIK
jgi:hypothetical protein